MSPSSVTQDWDILVSYATGDNLNNLLKDAWAGPLGTNEIEFSNEDFQCNVKLANPQLQFYEPQGEDLKAKISVDLKGTFRSNDWDDDDDDGDLTWNFEDYKYGFSITAPLGVLDGSQEIHKGNNVFHFDDGKSDAYHIVLHLQNQALDWTTTDPPVSKKAQKGKDIAKKAVEQVEQYIRSPGNIRWLEIQLGEVNNTPITNTDLANLFRPKSFKLATRKGALDIFIQTLGGYQQGSSTATFDIHGTPFEQMTYNGAIILSNRLFQDRFLVPQIQKNCPSLAKDKDGKARVTAKKVDSGLKFELVFDKKQTLSNGGSDWNGWWTTDRLEKVDLDFSTQPVTLKILNVTDGMPQASWEWNISFKVHWEYIIRTPDGSVKGYDQCVITAKIDDNHSDIATFKGNNLDFSFEFTDKNQPRMNIPDRAANDYKKMKVHMDEFKFPLDEIKYFASTNVFAPGRHFIDLKTVRAPHDLFVMGEMKSQLD